MTKKVRIDFVIREVPDDDAPEGEPRGISFGDEVPKDHIHEFINRCRDAANTLFNGKRPGEASEITEEMLKAEIARLRAQAAAQRSSMGGGVAALPPKPSLPAPHRSLDEAFDSLMNGDDVDPGGWRKLRALSRKAGY